MIRQKRLDSGAYLIRVEGRLDQNLNPKLEEKLTELLDADHNYLVVDLSETTYINSGGLRCLVSAWRRANRQNGKLVLCGLNERLAEIFRIVGFDKVFQIFGDYTEAQHAAQPSA